MLTTESVQTHEKVDPHVAAVLGERAIMSFDLTTLHNPDGSVKGVTRAHTYRDDEGGVHFAIQELNPDRTPKVN